MKSYFVRLGALSCACLLFAAAALAQAPAPSRKTITWLLPDFPPSSIPVNGQPGDGMADGVYRYLTARWPENVHAVRFLSTKDIWDTLEKGGETCLIGGVRTPERSRRYYFRDVALLPPQRAIFTSSMLASVPLNARGEVEMRTLFGNTRRRGMVIAGRSYGDKIDAQLQQAAEIPHLRFASFSNYSEDAFYTLLAGRVDFFIEYEFFLAYAIQKAPALATLRAVPIAGHDQPFSAGIVCPRTAWGREVIERADRLLGTPEGAAALRKVVGRWLTQASLGEHEAAHQRYFKQLEGPQYPELQ